VHSRYGSIDRISNQLDRLGLIITRTRFVLRAAMMKNERIVLEVAGGGGGGGHQAAGGGGGQQAAARRHGQAGRRGPSRTRTAYGYSCMRTLE
jgi:hypothetical protein